MAPNIANFLLGFLSMGFQLLFFRSLTPYVGSASTVIALTVCAFLLGYYAGNILGARLTQPTAAWLFPLIPILTSASFLSLPQALAWFSKTDTIVTAFLASACYAFPIALIFSLPLPSLMRLGSNEIPRRYAQLQGINTLGSIAGLLSLNFWLFETTPISNILLAWALGSLLAFFLLLRIQQASHAQRRVTLIGFAAASFLAGLLYSQIKPSPLLPPIPSAYGELYVLEDEGMRYLAHKEGPHFITQSVMAIHAPNSAIGYIKGFSHAFQWNRKPRNILHLGLGAGSLHRYMRDLQPNAFIRSVEIDPAVLSIAARDFGIPETPLDEYLIDDARAYSRKTAVTYEFIFVDVYSPRGIPQNLLTFEFLKDLQRILCPGGVIGWNVTSRYIDLLSSQLLYVFPYVWETPINNEQSLLFASRVSPPLLHMEPLGGETGFPLKKIPLANRKHFLLTDDYAPPSRLP